MLSKHHLTQFKADELIEFNYSPTVMARQPGGKAFVLINRLLFEVLVCHEFSCWDEDSERCSFCLSSARKTQSLCHCLPSLYPIVL